MSAVDPAQPPVGQRLMVTGMPRSGTTLIGMLLAQSPDHYELWEPFNAIYRRGVQDYWPYVGAASSSSKVARYDELIAETLALRGLRGVAGGARARKASPRRLGGLVGTSRVDLRYRALELRNQVRPRPGRIVKDPVGAFLTGHLVRHHGFTAVVCVRHPAAQYLSLLHRGWRADDIDGLLAQPDAVEDLFEPGELDCFGASDDVAYRFGVRYRVLYRYLLRVVRESKPQGAQVVVHEHLVRDPVTEVRALASGLGLRAEPMEARAVGLLSGTKVEHDSADLSRVVARDARTAAFGWRDELSSEVVASVMAGAGDVGQAVVDLVDG